MRLVCVALLGACAAARDARDDPAVREAIAAAWREHFDAVRREDEGTVGRIYADDVVYMVPGEGEVRGRQAIDEMEAQGLRGADILDVVHTTEALRVYGDIAYELGTVVGPVRPKGERARTVTFRYTARWKREPDKYVGWHHFEGRWRIQYMVGEPER
jgi:ketosteroid isomerase-like protein